MKGEVLITFPQRRHFEQAQAALTESALPYRVISPGVSYDRVGVPAVVMTQETRNALLAEKAEVLVISGWVEYQPSTTEIPTGKLRDFEEDIFGRAAIVVLAPCIAIRSKIRFIAHLTGNLAEVFPYLNAEVPTIFYNPTAPSVYFKEEYRAISLYPQRIAVGKADEIVDAWRLLEMIRCRVNEIWTRRDHLKPSYVMREKPSVLDILKRLPGTNCGQCGEKTCLAFAARLWTGDVPPYQCQPIFTGEFGHLQEEFLGICT